MTNLIDTGTTKTDKLNFLLGFLLLLLSCLLLAGKGLLPDNFGASQGFQDNKSKFAINKEDEPKLNADAKDLKLLPEEVP